MQGSVSRRTTDCAVYVAVIASFLALLSPWASADDREPTISTPRPTDWMPTRRMKCQRVRGSNWKMCDGPRRTPEPYGEEAFIGQDLGMGQVKTAQRLLREAPPRAWVEAVAGRGRSTLLWPVEQGHFGRGFGFVRKELKHVRHDGVDIGAKVGEQVRSVNDGIVAYSDNEVSGYGNMVMIVHKDASVSFYCHHQANFVFAGQQVKRGQVIGEVGTTGISRGPHLHFEWHVNGQPRDPMTRMAGKPDHKAPLSNADPFWM